AGRGGGGGQDPAGGDGEEDAVPARPVVVTTSTLEDWLWRGDDPILAPMSWQVYSMWVYRIEKPPRSKAQQGHVRHRFVDIEFSADYKLNVTHAQRLATEFRVPLFEGFTMPPNSVDAETAAMYKQVLLRPLRVEESEDPEDVRLLQAFDSLCAPCQLNVPQRTRSVQAAQAFSAAWLAFQSAQKAKASEARRRFLSRYEWPSLWETQEVQDRLDAMWAEETGDDDGALPAEERMAPPMDPDAGKPRATVDHYVALIGEDVALNLEGLARARVEKHPRAYQTDAQVHQVYMKATSGGGEGQEAGDEGDGGDDSLAAPQPNEQVFPPVPWGFTSQEELLETLRFGHRKRLTPFAVFLREMINYVFTSRTALLRLHINRTNQQGRQNGDSHHFHGKSPSQVRHAITDA
ncbi:MAG: hypothetical protein GY767_13960, partial [Shimia sp.]|nr:hypothetical protein [Shimia sp.]